MDDVVYMVLLQGGWKVRKGKECSHFYNNARLVDQPGLFEVMDGC